MLRSDIMDETALRFIFQVEIDELTEFYSESDYFEVYKYINERLKAGPVTTAPLSINYKK